MSTEVKKEVTTRLIGAEVEYYAGGRDKSFEYINEYYSAMREVNSILLPGTDVLNSLMTLKTILLNLDKKLEHKLGTRAWANSYGFAYNGVHLHLSGKIDQGVLEKNIFRLMNKHGLSPRTVTSWHIFSRPTNYSFKNKRKHQPIYRTPRETLEVRVLDVEYFLNDDIIKDLSLAIEGAYTGKLIDGDESWVRELLDIHIDDYAKSLAFLDKNMAKGWVRKSKGIYVNTNGNYEFNFRELSDWGRAARDEDARRERREREMREAMEAGTVSSVDDAVRGASRGSRSGPRLRSSGSSAFGFTAVDEGDFDA